MPIPLISRPFAALKPRRSSKIYPILLAILYAISSGEKGKSGAMSNEPLLLGGISDDFTGGLELASMMARDGLRTRLLTRLARPSDLADLDVAVIALKSRIAAASKAVRDFAKAADVLSQARRAPGLLQILRHLRFDAARQYRPLRRLSRRPPGRGLHRLLPRLPRCRAQGLSRLSVLGRPADLGIAQAPRSADADARSQPGARAAGADQAQGRPHPARRSAGRPPDPASGGRARSKPPACAMRSAMPSATTI